MEQKTEFPSSVHPPVVACLAALPIELNGLRRRMTVTESATQEGVAWTMGRLGRSRVLLAQTGMGREAAQRAAGFILDRFTPAALVSFGFAGGISPRLKGGDVLLCQQFYREDRAARHEPICSDAGLLAAAQALQIAGQPSGVGGCLTVNRVVSRPAEKQALATAYPADVLEMESYWIGLACAARRTPFLGVRAVSDPISLALPPFESFIDAENRGRLRSAAAYFLRHPRALVVMARFAAAVHFAERNLTAFLAALLTGWDVHR